MGGANFFLKSNDSTHSARLIFLFTPLSHSPGQDDIEDAARDSALLAEELAAMLDRLEGGEDEEDRRAKSLVEEELGKFSTRMCCVLIF